MRSIFTIFLESANSFEGQNDDEKVILLIRRHPIFIIIKSIFSLFLGFMPVLILIIFFSFFLANNLVALFLFALSLWLMILWSICFYSITMYILDVWIVTNQRIIDSTQRGFFNRVVSELHVSRIQDVSVSTSGLIQTMFKFGDLQVQTAGTEEKFKFIQIPNPEDVKDEIAKLIEVKHPI